MHDAERGRERGRRDKSKTRKRAGRMIDEGKEGEEEGEKGQECDLCVLSEENKRKR